MVVRPLIPKKKADAYTIALPIFGFSFTLVGENNKENVTHSGVPPKMYERMNVRRRRQQEVVPPLIVTDVQAAILVHPVDKCRLMKRTH